MATNQGSSGADASRMKLDDERHADRIERDRYAWCMVEGCNATFADYDRLRLHQENEHGLESSPRHGGKAMSADKSLWKGAGSTYRPPAGTRCLLSGPNEDDENGYVFGETTILWCDETFVLYGNPGFWPQLYKWDHVIARELSAVSPTSGATK